MRSLLTCLGTMAALAVVSTRDPDTQTGEVRAKRYSFWPSFGRNKIDITTSEPNFVDPWSSENKINQEEFPSEQLMNDLEEQYDEQSPKIDSPFSSSTTENYIPKNESESVTETKESSGGYFWYVRNPFRRNSNVIRPSTANFTESSMPELDIDEGGGKNESSNGYFWSLRNPFGRNSKVISPSSSNFTGPSMPDQDIDEDGEENESSNGYFWSFTNPFRRNSKVITPSLANFTKSSMSDQDIDEDVEEKESSENSIWSSLNPIRAVTNLISGSSTSNETNISSLDENTDLVMLRNKTEFDSSYFWGSSSPVRAFSNAVTGGYRRIRYSSMGRQIRNTTLGHTLSRGKNATRRVFSTISNRLTSGARRLRSGYKRRFLIRPRFNNFIDRLKNKILSGDNETITLLQREGIQVSVNEDGKTQTAIRNDSRSNSEQLSPSSFSTTTVADQNLVSPTGNILSSTTTPTTSLYIPVEHTEAPIQDGKEVAGEDFAFPDVFSSDAAVRDRLREVYEKGAFSHADLNTSASNSYYNDDYYYYYDIYHPDDDTNIGT